MSSKPTVKPDWSFSLISNIVTNDDRVVFKEIALIERKGPTELRVTTGKVGLMSGEGQWITLRFHDGGWVISKVESFDG